MNLKRMFPYLAALFVTVICAGVLQAGEGDVYVMTLSGSINPGTSH